MTKRVCWVFVVLLAAGVRAVPQSAAPNSASSSAATASTAPTSAQGQDKSSASAPATPASTPTPGQHVIRSSSRLVQVSVVVEDKHGVPITGLAKDAFQLNDESKPQKISVFAAETPATLGKEHVLPANYFTNRYDLKGQDPGAVTVILFDALNTSAEDQSYARKEILRYLKTVKPQDHIALYALTNELYVLHDFTQDSAALVEAVSKFTPKETAAFDASTVGFMNLVGATGDPSWSSSPHDFQASLNIANSQIAGQNLANRITSTTSAIEAIANHIAQIPGRKSLVWVSGGFPISLDIADPISGGGFSTFSQPTSSGAISDSSPSSGGPQPVGGGGNGLPQLPRADQEIFQPIDSVLRTTRALNRANLAIYPVDVHGVELSAGMGPESRIANDKLSASGFYERQNRQDAFRLLADRTGGRAFYGNNQIRDGIRGAFDDSRYTYTIGFYPDHGNWDGKFRQLSVRVNVEGARVRYRKGYFAFAESTDAEGAIEVSLRDAATSPLQATSLGVVVVAKPLEPLADRKLELRVSLDTKQLLFSDSEGKHHGAIDMMFTQLDKAGQTIVAEKQHVAMNYTDEQLAFLGKAGLILQRILDVGGATTQVKVVVRDANSTSIGSVDVPAEALLQADVAPKQ